MSDPEAYWKDVVGRLSSALDSALDSNRELIGLLKAQAAETSRIAELLASPARPTPPGRPSPEMVKALTASLPVADIDAITRAMASDNPGEAIRALTREVESRPPKPTHDLSASSLFQGETLQRTDGEARVAILTFVDSFLHWLDSLTDQMDLPSFEDKTRSAAAVRQMGFIRGYVSDRCAEKADPTREMLQRIFQEFGFKSDRTSVVEIISHAAASMPEVADALFDMTGHVCESPDAIRRWQAARALANEPDLGQRTLVHQAETLCQFETFRNHVALAFATAVPHADRIVALSRVRKFQSEMEGYLGDYDKAVVALAGSMAELIKAFERVTPGASMSKSAPTPA